MPSSQRHRVASRKKGKRRAIRVRRAERRLASISSHAHSLVLQPMRIEERRVAPPETTEGAGRPETPLRIGGLPQPMGAGLSCTDRHGRPAAAACGGGRVLLLRLGVAVSSPRLRTALSPPKASPLRLSPPHRPPPANLQGQSEAAGEARMSGPREVVTLQIGQYASSVGAHWWGLQEASFCFDSAPAKSDEGICHDVLFRTGKTLQGQETYTPRLILMDLKGSLSSLKQELFLYQEVKTNTPLTWKGNLTTHREDPCPPRPFLQSLEGSQASNGDFAPRTVTGDPSLHPKQLNKALQSPPSETADAPSWADFLRTPLHPRSVVTIHQYNHEGESSLLEAFGQGEKLLQEATYLEELEDRLHFYVEECDYLQGFQVLCDLHNGFSGVGAKATELLQDEYAGKGVLTWGLVPVLNTAVPERNLYRLLNTVLGVVRLSSHSSLFCPLSLNRSLGLRQGGPVTLPYLQYNAALDYHTSAILATALDSLSVPYRLQASALSMAHLAETLNFSGRKVATAAAALPFPIGQGQSLPDALCGQQTVVPWSPVSACGELGESHCFAQSVVLRGIGKEYQVSGCPPGTEPKSVLHMGETGQEVLVRYLYTLFPRTFSTSLLLRDPCKLFAPYPQYFSPLVSKYGFLREKAGASSEAVESIPVFTALQSPASLRRTLGSLQEDLARHDLRRWASFFSVGVEMDDFEEALEELRSLSQCYKESTGSAAESEDELD